MKKVDLKYFPIFQLQPQQNLYCLSEASAAGGGGGDSIKFETGTNFELHFRICHWVEHVTAVRSNQKNIGLIQCFLFISQEHLAIRVKISYGRLRTIISKLEKNFSESPT